MSDPLFHLGPNTHDPAAARGPARMEATTAPRAARPDIRLRSEGETVFPQG